MILWKLLSCDGTWLWTAGVVWWCIKRPLEMPDGSKVPWWK